MLLSFSKFRSQDAEYEISLWRKRRPLFWYAWYQKCDVWNTPFFFFWTWHRTKMRLNSDKRRLVFPCKTKIWFHFTKVCFLDGIWFVPEFIVGIVLCLWDDVRHSISVTDGEFMCFHSFSVFIGFGVINGFTCCCYMKTLVKICRIYLIFIHRKMFDAITLVKICRICLIFYSRQNVWRTLSIYNTTCAPACIHRPLICTYLM